MTWYRADKRILKYKFETYKKKIQDFICGSPTTIKVSNQDEETKIRSSGIAQEEKIHTKES